MSGQAGFIAKQGFSMLYNATVTSVGAISSGINKAVKSYSDYYERDQLESLRKSGKTPAENLASVLERFNYLSMAGYGNEVAAAAQKIATKLTAQERESIPLESVSAFSRILFETSTKYGEFASSGWGLQDFLNSSRMGKDHYDRDQLVSDLYYAILFLQDATGGPGPEFERIVKEAGKRMVEGDGFIPESTSALGGGGSVGSYNPYAYASSSGLPAYATVPTAGFGAVPSATSSGSGFGSLSGFGSTSSSGGSGGASLGAKSLSSGSSVPTEKDPKKRAAKVLFQVSSTLKKASDDAEAKKAKALRDAEETLRKEKEKVATTLRPNYSNFS